MTYACTLCSKIFNSALAVRGHSRIHAKTFEASTQRIGEVVKARAVTRYEAHPRHCTYCQRAFTYEEMQTNSGRKFCSPSCAAKHNNLSRTRDEASRVRTSSSVRSSKAYQTAINSRFERNGWRRKPEIVGAYCKLFTNRCAHCELISLSRARRKYCEVHAALYGDSGRNRYEFTFNPFLHPEVFSEATLRLITELGFWSPKNRNGIVRDHRVSVNEAIKHGHDPYYIKHPLNCEIMDWQSNNKKKTQSSLSFCELVKLVNEYDAASQQITE